MESVYFLFTLSILFIALLAYLALHALLDRKKEPQDVQETRILPPGRTGWPLIGESLDYILDMRKGCLEKFALDRTNKYSTKVFKTSILGQSVAVLCGPKGNKFLFSNENKLVKIWYPRHIDKIFPKPESFVQVRKMLPSLLKADALRKYVGAMDTVMKHQVHADWDCGQIVKVETMAWKFTLTSACRLFLSIEEPEEVEKLAKSIQDIDDGIGAVPLNLPWTALNRAIKAAKSVRGKIGTMIKKRRIDISSGRMVEDILSDMLLATDRDGGFFSESETSSHVSGLIQGGYGTLNATLICIIKYLAELPDVYKNVHREQMEIKSSKEIKELLNWEDLRKMKYSWNVANEVMRLMPIGPGGFREAITDFTYGGYTIPKGWKLHWMRCLTSKNGEYFENPEKFDPSRFEGDGPAPYTYVPFGGGPRMCPGGEYVRLAVLVFMHNLVTNFRWEKLIPDEKITFSPVPKLSHGLPIRLFPH